MCDPSDGATTLKLKPACSFTSSSDTDNLLTLTLVVIRMCTTVQLNIRMSTESRLTRLTLSPTHKTKETLFKDSWRI